MSIWKGSILASDVVTICRGNWHPAGNAASIEADFCASEAYVAVADLAQGKNHSWSSLEAVQISDRVAGIPRRLSFPDGSVFETRDNDAIDEFLRSRGKKVGFLHALERFHPRQIAVVAFVVLGAMAVYRFALPLIVEAVVLLTPQAVPALMSSATLASMDQAVFDDSKLPEGRRLELSRAFETLVDGVEDSEANFSLNFRNGGVIGPNAFALPDGTIVITDELVKLAENDEMLLGVLAHEIGHVELQHSLRQLYRAAGVYGLFMLVAGDIGLGLEDILSQGGGLLALSYSRKAESEADQYSVELMSKTGHDALAIVTFFDAIEKIVGEDGETSILSTHPATEERKQAVRDYAAEVSAR